MNIRAKFSYPTQQEIDSIEDKAPGISRFCFPAVFPFDFDNLTLFHRYDHLYGWDSLLHNRIADFDSCYMYVLIHLKRGVPGTTKEIIANEQKRINYINTNFYLGYLLFSFEAINDLILQILNVYFECGLSESNVKLNTIGLKLQNSYPNIVTALNNYVCAIKDIKDLRNALTHRFSPLEIDNRAKLESPTKVIMPMSNDLPDYDRILKIIESSVSELRKYMEELKRNMIIKPGSGN